MTQMAKVIPLPTRREPVDYWARVCELVRDLDDAELYRLLYDLALQGPAQHARLLKAAGVP